jgi:hypothetical protein
MWVDLWVDRRVVLMADQMAECSVESLAGKMVDLMAAMMAAS